MGEHMHFFSLGSHSLSTYFLTMQEVKPSIVYLICDSQISDAGKNANEILEKSVAEGKINHLPSLDEMKVFLSPSLHSPESTQDMVDKRLSVLEMLVELGSLESKKETKTNLERATILEEITGIDKLTRLQIDGYIIKKTIIQIIEYQEFINKCHDILQNIENKYPDPVERGMAISDGCLSKEMTAIVSLIQENVMAVNYLIPNKYCINDTNVYRIVSEIRNNYPKVIIGKHNMENVVVIPGKDVKTVRDTLLEDVIIDYISETKMNVTEYSMNISAGVTQFITSLFVLGSWLNANIYVTPRNDQIIHLPLPGRGEAIDNLTWQDEVFLKTTYLLYRNSIEELKKKIAILKDMNSNDIKDKSTGEFTHAALDRISKRNKDIESITEAIQEIKHSNGEIYARTDIYKSKICIDFYKKKKRNGKQVSATEDTRKNAAKDSFPRLIKKGYVKEEVGPTRKIKYSSLTNKGMLLCKIWHMEGTIDKIISTSENKT